MQTFLVDYQKLENRLDPSPYHPIRRGAIKAVKSSKYKAKPLKEVVEFRRELVTEKVNDSPYLGLENIVSNTGEYIPSTEEKQEFGSAFRFYRGDVLFPKLRPYLNKVHMADFDGYCSTEMHVLHPKEVNSNYLFAFLNSQTVVNQTSFLMTGNTLPRLQTNEIESLLVPLPDQNTQAKVADIMDKAYTKKSKLEQEAEELLSTVNKKIADLLKLTCKVQKPKTYITKSTQLNGRLDTECYRSDYLQLEESVKKISSRVLGDFIQSISGGATPSRNNADNYTDNPNEGVPFLRVQNITANGIDLTDVVYITRLVHEGELKRSQLSQGDLIITITGRLGSASVVPDNFEGNINQHSVVIKTQNRKTAELIAVFLNTDIAQQLILRRATGGTRPALDYDAIKTIPIILDNRIKEIFDETFTSVRKKRESGKALIEQAKQQVESIILGEKS